MDKIDQACLPCAYISGDCCGILYWSDDGKVLCNECGREFEVIAKGVPHGVSLTPND